MTKRRFTKAVEGKNGWSDWIHPAPKYLMKCCDCGLVHEMQFKAFAETNQKRGQFTVVDLPWPIRTKFRARRWGRGKA